MFLIKINRSLMPKRINLTLTRCISPPLESICTSRSSPEFGEYVGAKVVALAQSVAHSLKPPIEGARSEMGALMSWLAVEMNRKGQREGWSCQWIVWICIEHVWKDNATMSHSITAVSSSEFLHQRMTWGPRPQPQGAESSHPIAGQEEEEETLKKQKERVCACVGVSACVRAHAYVCVCLTQCMLGLTSTIPTRTQAGVHVSTCVNFLKPEL